MNLLSGAAANLHLIEPLRTEEHCMCTLFKDVNYQIDPEILWNCLHALSSTLYRCIAHAKRVRTTTTGSPWVYATQILPSVSGPR